MKFAYYDNYAPRSFMSDGKMKGIIIDIIDEVVVKRMKIPVEHKGYPWQRAQLLVKIGDADAFVTVPTIERKTYTNLSKVPLFKFELFLATTKDNKNIKELVKLKSINELRGFHLVDYFGNGISQKLLKNHNVTWLPNYQSTMKFLATGKADAVIASELFQHNLKSLHLENKIILLPTPIYSVAFHLCISKKSKYKWILDKFDKELEQFIAEGGVQRIKDKYYK
jgi:polar amino acid transport system substrate-binding protein